MRTRKVIIIGAGHVGSHCALCLMFGHLVNQIVLVDVNRERAEAEAMDLNDLASGLGDGFEIRAGSYADCKDAHFIIMTAGKGRRPGQSRLDLLGGTLRILDDIVPEIKKSGFHGILISVSNPSDIVTEYLYRGLDLPRGHVFGTGTALDSARLRRVLGKELKVDARQVDAIVMGEHGDSSFIPTSHISINGIPLREYMKLAGRGREGIDFTEVKKKVREAGSRIIAGKNVTEFGIASVVVEIVTSILHNERTILPLSVHLDGEYGEKDLSIGVPAILSEQGVEKVLEYDLNNSEIQAFHASCDVVRQKLDAATPLTSVFQRGKDIADNISQNIRR